MKLGMVVDRVGRGLCTKFELFPVAGFCVNVRLIIFSRVRATRSVRR